MATKINGSTVIIMSRTHEADLSSAVVERGWNHLVVEMDPRYAMSSLHTRAKEAWAEPHGEWSVTRLTKEGYSTQKIAEFYEFAIIDQHVPWLDGARECLMTLATWLEGL